jgi:hypothetical protein
MPGMVHSRNPSCLNHGTSLPLWFHPTIMLDCTECRRLESLLEQAAVHYHELAQRVLLLDDSDPEKIWAGMALRGAKDYKDEVQQQFNAHKEKHLQI